MARERERKQGTRLTLRKVVGVTFLVLFWQEMSTGVTNMKDKSASSSDATSVISPVEAPNDGGGDGERFDELQREAESLKQKLEEERRKLNDIPCERERQWAIDLVITMGENCK